MALVRVKGHANYDGAVQKSFDVIVETSESLTNFWSSKCKNAILSRYPSWSAINCDSYEEL